MKDSLLSRTLRPENLEEPVHSPEIFFSLDATNPHGCVAILQFDPDRQKALKNLSKPKAIGDHIKKRRLELGLSQRHVAEIIGVDECTVTNWERNRTNPRLHFFPEIIEFLGYDPMPFNSKTLGEKLVQYRKGRGMSQKELATKIAIDPTTLSRLERTRGKCFPSVLVKVGAFLSTHA